MLGMGGYFSNQKFNSFLFFYVPDIILTKLGMALAKRPTIRPIAAYIIYSLPDLIFSVLPPDIKRFSAPITTKIPASATKTTNIQSVMLYNVFITQNSPHFVAESEQ